MICTEREKKHYKRGYIIMVRALAWNNKMFEHHINAKV